MFFFFKQKTAYEMRISDWSSDVCSIQTLEMVLAPTADRGLLPPAASMAGERRGCAFVFIAQEKAMSNIIDLGGTPANEDCAQIGHTPDFERLNRLEVEIGRAHV